VPFKALSRSASLEKRIRFKVVTAMTKRESSKTNQNASPTEIQRHLSDLDFPCSKQDLIDHVRHQHDRNDVLSVLNLIDDREYNNPGEVVRAAKVIK
jgi:hypothetical protein